LTIGARITEPELAKKIVDKFLSTDFENGEERHVRRVKKMDEISDLNK
jgi:ribose 5-phosphate isomerase RpiB